MYQEDDTTDSAREKGCSEAGDLPAAWFCSGNPELGDVQIKVIGGVLYGEVEKAIHRASGRRSWKEHHPKFPERWVPLHTFEAELEKGLSPKPLADKYRDSARYAIRLARTFLEKCDREWREECYAGQLVSWGSIAFWSVQK